MIAIIIFLFIVFIYIYFETNSLKTSKYTIHSNKIPNIFKGYKILQISDFHNKSFGDNNQKILKIISDEDPDIIVITGDIINKREYNDKIAMDLINSISPKYEVFFTTGNHEVRSGIFRELEPKFKDAGVNIIHNECINIYRDHELISFIGTDDPGEKRYRIEEEVTTDKYLKKALENAPKDKYRILLTHRPEYFSIYVKNKIDLVLSGHTHGGQIRLPFIGAIFVHHQALFPKMSKGIFYKENTTMIINGGIGTSRLPIRTFNKPEIVVITLN